MYKFNLGGQILGGAILLVIGLILVTGLVQAIVNFLITALGILFIIAGIIVGVMGVMRFFKKRD